MRTGGAHICTVLRAVPGITYIVVNLINKETMATSVYRTDRHMAGCPYIHVGRG